jgi:hypothetical protein
MGPGDPPPHQLLTIDIKALDFSESSTDTYSQTTLQPDNIIIALGDLKAGVENYPTSVTQTNVTTVSGTFTNPATGKSNLVSSTTTTSTTVTLAPGSKTGVGGITQTSATTVVSSPVVSTTKTTATLDVTATKTTPGVSQTKQLPTDTKLSPGLQSKVNDANEQAKSAIENNKGAAVDGIKETIKQSSGR